MASSSVADEGSFTVQVIGTIVNTYGNAQKSQTFRLSVMSDPCSEDDLELTNASQSDIVFVLG